MKLTKAVITKLGTTIDDKATGLKGMLTHLQISSNGNRFYCFQPRGLNPDTGAPVDRTWLTPDRIKGGKKTTVELPLSILGSVVTDAASGFKGTATALTLHINGCVHAIVQPKGVMKKTKNPIKEEDFDIRRLKGPKLKPMTEKKRDKSISQSPSPSPVKPYNPGN